MNPIQGPWTLFKFPEGFYTFPIVFFFLRCVTFFAVGLLIVIRLTFRWYIPQKTTGYQKTHTPGWYTEAICRGTMLTATLALGKFSWNQCPCLNPPNHWSLGFEKIGFGFSDLIGLWISQPMHAHLGVFGRRGVAWGESFDEICITERVSIPGKSWRISKV